MDFTAFIEEHGVTVAVATMAVFVILSVLLPIVIVQGRGIRLEVDTMKSSVNNLRTEFEEYATNMRAETAEVQRDLRLLSDRSSRIEGAIAGPYHSSIE